MTLHLLKPTLATMRSTMPTLRAEVRDQEQAQVPRLRGGNLIRMRHRVLARSGHLCECPQCSAGYPKPLTWDTFELDHRVRVADGGDNSINNLRAVHIDCHTRISMRQLAEVAQYGTVLPEPEPLPRRRINDDTDDMPC